MGGGQSTFDWRIDGFSSILQRATSQYDSLPFRSNGYKWMLSLEPKRSDKSGKPCLGLFLYLNGATSLPSNVQVHTSYELCIYDQRNKNWDYFRPVEVDFCNKTPSWGYTCMVTLEQFQSPSNGFLVGDICGFRVKILSAHRRIIGWKGFQHMLIEKPPMPSSHKWNIENFAKKRKLFFINSGNFIAGNHTWNIRLYPNGPNPNADRRINYLSIYLNLVTTSFLPQKTKLCVEFGICLVDQINAKNMNLMCKGYFDSRCSTQGWAQFLPLEEFYDLANGFLVRDLCVIDAKITDWYLIHR